MKTTKTKTKDIILKISILALITMLMLTSCATRVVNKEAVIHAASKNKAYTGSEFIAIEPCGFAYAEDKDNTAYFMPASCALTDKEFVAYISNTSGELGINLAFLSYADINGVAMSRFGNGSQIQLRTKKVNMIFQLGGGTFIDKELQEKYFQIIKEHGVQEFTPEKFVFMQTRR